ncbi:MAG: hypothetical protein ACFFDY_02165 [Candidatus Thorarchaeota archaeon]
MNEITKKKEKNDTKISNKHFEMVVKISLIIGIIIVSSFIVYYLLNPEPGYVTFGILNENQKAENYQTEAPINETISFYLTVGNYLDREFMFRFKIKKGNNNTVLSSTGSNGTLYKTIGNFTLNPKEFRIYGEYNISFSEEGQNQIIIAELWQIKHEIEELFIIHYLRLNITS